MFRELGLSLGAQVGDGGLGRVSQSWSRELIELQVAAAKGTRSLAGERLALSSKREDWLPDLGVKGRALPAGSCGRQNWAWCKQGLWHCHSSLGGGEVQKRLGGSVSLHPSCILFVLWCGDWAHGWLGPNYSQTSPTGSICRSDGDQNCGEWEGGPRSTGRTPQAALALTRVSGICAVPAEHWTYSSLGSKATPHRVRLVLALLA